MTNFLLSVSSIKCCTYGDKDAAGGTKSGMANVWIGLEIGVAIKAVTQKQSSVKTKNTKCKEYEKSQPSSFLHSIWC